MIGGNDPYNEVGGGQGTPGWSDNTNQYDSAQYKFVPYVTGPTSAHIVWSMNPNGIDGIYGGVIDGAPTLAEATSNDFTGTDFTFGQDGPGAAGNPNIVFDGRCYQMITEEYQGTVQPVWVSYDIQTGQVYWTITGLMDGTHNTAPTLLSYSLNNPPVPGGQYRADRTNPSLVYIGASAVSGVGLVIKYNPITGAVISNSTIPLTSGTLYADPFVLSVQTLGSGTSTTYRLINWTLDGLLPGSTYNTLPGVQSNFTLYNVISNVSFPFSSLGLADFGAAITTTTYSATNPATGTATPWSGGGPYSTSAVWIAAASLTTGKLLWNESSGVPYPIFSGGADVADHGLVAIRFDDGYYYAYNLNTGTLAWQSQVSSWPWGTFGAYFVQSGFGLLYYEQYDGVVAYNWTNGNIAWWFQEPSAPSENDFNNGTASYNGTVYPFFTDAVVTSQGYLYTYSYEHSPTAPITRGYSTFCINATTGQEVWNISDPMDPGVVSDGYLTATDWYTAMFYTFGMGVSATTVSAPQTAVAEGTPIVISGTVLDQSPAQPGTPAVSDASMSAWMGYLHLQAPYPTNVIGVPVSIDAVDPNGNAVHIASVTSDATGTFGYTWTPTMAGQYKITATFAGDDSYSFSTAGTYATVTAPIATSTPTTTAVPSNLATSADLMTYIVGVGIAIIIAIAIVGALILRKK